MGLAAGEHHDKDLLKGWKCMRWSSQKPDRFMWQKEAKLQDSPALQHHQVKMQCQKSKNPMKLRAKSKAQYNEKGNSTQQQKSQK